MMTKKRVMISLLVALLVGALFLGIVSLPKNTNQTNKQVATTQKIDKKKTKHKTKKKESKTETAKQPKGDKQTEVKSESKKTEVSKVESTQTVESKPAVTTQPSAEQPVQSQSAPTPEPEPVQPQPSQLPPGGYWSYAEAGAVANTIFQEDLNKFLAGDPTAMNYSGYTIDGHLLPDGRTYYTYSFYK